MEGCAPCALGTFSEGGASKGCQPMQCPPGHIATAAHASTPNEGCAPCAAGTYSEGADAATCTPLSCPPGHAGTKEGATSAEDGCTPCPAGSFSEGGQGAECLPRQCPKGHFSEDAGATHASEACTPCAPGTYSTGAAAASCEPMQCQAGQASTIEGAATPTEGCAYCAPGTFSIGGAAGVCAPLVCAPGQASTIEGASSAEDGCAPCAAGTYANASTDGVCQDMQCPEGHIASKAGAVHPQDACTPCPLASFSTGGSQSECLPMTCTEGSIPTKVAARANDDGCTTCPAGMTSKGGTNTQCVAATCEAGSGWLEGAAGDQGGCAPCPSGTFSPGSSANACLPMECPAGHAAYGEGSTSATESCAPCGAGAYSPGGASASCAPTQCDPGESSEVEAATTANEGCTPCPMGTYSTGGATPCLPVTCPLGHGGVEVGASSVDTACALCPVGRYSRGEGPCQASACPEDHFATLEGATSAQEGCMPCDEGERSKGGDAKTCELANDASLATLDIEGAELTPEFQPGIHSYSASVGWMEHSISIRPTLSDTMALLNVDGLERQSGEHIHISVVYGETPISINPLAPSGQSETYDIVVSREARSGELPDPNRREESDFAHALSQDGHLLAAGAPSATWCPPRETEEGDEEESEPLCIETGLVHLYARSDEGWRLVTSLASGEHQPGQRLGAALSLEGQRLAVGAPGHNAVYIFERIAGVWQQKTRLSPRGGSVQSFGHQVALDGDSLAISAIDDASCATGVDGDETDTGCTGAGAVFVYALDDTGAWNQSAYVKAAHVRAGDGFGAQVALDGDRLIVSAPGTDSCESGLDAELGDSGCEGSGSVHIFDRYQGQWVLDAVLAAPEAQTRARFGSSLSLSVDLMAVGAVGDAMCEGDGRVSEACTSGGAVHLYRLTQGAWRHEARLQGIRTERGDRFGQSVGLGAGSLLVGVPGADGCGRGVNGEDNDSGCPEAGAVEVFRALDGDWVQVMRVQLPESEEGEVASDHAGFGTLLNVDGDSVTIAAPGAGSVSVFE